MPTRDREKKLAQHARYNSSNKGRDRDQRYEDKHPERRERWSVIMEAKARSGGRF